ncbi:MAG: hypothetical protein JXO22_15430 [Phycisphaerae bacterium]|nr:hypothetical protein [Phycisphaerae bacterium]
MNRHSTLLLLITTLLCSCGTETSDHSSSSRPTDASAARQPISQAPSDNQAEESALGEYVAFPAAGTKLRQPEGFQKADSFDGFGEPETQSSVMAVSIPGPYSQISAGFTQQQMKTRGWTLLGKKDVEVDGLPGILVHFEQPAAGKVYLKWSLVFGDDQKTTMVTATFSKALERELSAKLKSAVLSTRLYQGATPEPGADSPFNVAVSQKLKLTPSIGKTLAYTKDGAIPTKSPEDPLFIVASSLGKGAIGDKREFAERRLRETAQTKQISVKSTDAIAIDDLDGYESIAEAQDAESGTPLVIYQVMLFDQGSYILMQGLVGAELRDEYLPEFKEMARSLRRKQP